MLRGAANARSAGVAAGGLQSVLSIHREPRVPLRLHFRYGALRNDEQFVHETISLSRVNGP